jgi:hypothetical protein
MSGTLDLATFRRGMEIFAEELRRHREEIDSLNVYPVPDGDTGTNMLLTQEAVVAAIASPAVEGAGAEELGTVISRASLMGARGNSGVILSQILRGICERLPEDGVFDPGELATALEHAAEEAYRAVARPAEGTALSVIRDAARAATDAARSPEADGVVSVIGAALEEARRSLERTTELLPELKRARVVDAGGKGIVLFLDALQAAAMGRAASEPVGPLGPVGHPSGDGVDAVPDLTHEVQYLVEADDATVGSLRRRLGEIGDSLVVVGGGGLYSVHVHTNEPRRAVDAGSRAGRTRNVRIADLRDAVTACMAGQARAVRVAEQVCAMVAVAEGEGLDRTFRSLGAVVVAGGPGNNPSVADLVAGLEAAPAEGVVVLANHPNIGPAAERAAGLSTKEARVILTASLPAGLTAAAAFNPLATLSDNAKAMEEAAAACRSGELAVAERDADTDAGPVKRGDWFGLAEGEVVAAGGGVGPVAREVVRRLASDTAEVITLVVGADAGSDDRRSVEEVVRDSFPALQVDVVDGGQPRHPFLIGVE